MLSTNRLLHLNRDPPLLEIRHIVFGRRRLLAQHLCRQCRKHLREMDLHDIQMTPSWLCSFHNKVNLRLGKKLYNCSKYDITVAGNR